MREMFAAAAVTTTAQITDFVNLDAIQATSVTVATAVVSWAIGKLFAYIKKRWLKTQTNE